MRDDWSQIDGVEHRVVRANAIDVHVACAGQGDPVVMLHGWPQHWYMWRHQLPHLARHYSVFCPDTRGFGWSDATSGGYAKEDLVDDVIALLDRLELGRVRLVGHDWGAWVGFLLCLRAPHRIRQFVAIGAPHPFQRLAWRHLALWRFWYQLAIACPVVGPYLVRSQPWVFRRLIQSWWVSPRPDSEFEVYAERLREPGRVRATVQLYRTFLFREILPVLRGRYVGKRLTTPTLLLHGRQDSVISASLLQGFESHADQLTVTQIRSAGHFVVEDQPDLVTQLLLSFFSEADRPDTRLT